LVQPLSTTQVAANAEGFTPKASASEIAWAPQDCASNVLSASLLVAPELLPEVEPVPVGDPAPPSGLVVPGVIVICGTPGSDTYGATCIGGHATLCASAGKPPPSATARTPRAIPERRKPFSLILIGRPPL
jgi:hypothetical protein